MPLEKLTQTDTVGHLNREKSFGSMMPSIIAQNVPEHMPSAQMVSPPSSKDMKDGRSDLS